GHGGGAGGMGERRRREAHHHGAQVVEHDPEKWVPVFGQDHAPTISSTPFAAVMSGARMMICPMKHASASIGVIAGSLALSAPVALAERAASAGVIKCEVKTF